MYKMYGIGWCRKVAKAVSAQNAWHNLRLLVASMECIRAMQANMNVAYHNSTGADTEEHPEKRARTYAQITPAAKRMY